MRRRQLLGAAGTIAAGAAAATLLNPRPVGADTGGVGPKILKEYFSILATGEALFVTFYSQAVANSATLGIGGPALNALEAILVEEQIHFNFAVEQGGTPATTHFSFPDGKNTFVDPTLFLNTQQLAEELTNGALLAWIKDWAGKGNSPLAQRLARLDGQLMQVEGGHRVVGRVIMNALPWDDWAFGPVSPQLGTFLDVPTVVKAAGFLSPVPGNDFVFQPVIPPTFPGVINTQP
jgi:hypothetical protein